MSWWCLASFHNGISRLLAETVLEECNLQHINFTSSGCCLTPKLMHTSFSSPIFDISTFTVRRTLPCRPNEFGVSLVIPLGFTDVFFSVYLAWAKDIHV